MIEQEQSQDAKRQAWAAAFEAAQAVFNTADPVTAFELLICCTDYPAGVTSPEGVAECRQALEHVHKLSSGDIGRALELGALSMEIPHGKPNGGDLGLIERLELAAERLSLDV